MIKHNRQTVKQSTVDCKQLKRTGARSAGRSAACYDFIPTACVRNMKTWGGPGTLNWTWTGKYSSDHGPRGDDLGGGWQHDGLISLPGRPTPSSSTTAASGPARVCGENSNRAAECGRKWMGASRLGHAGPTRSTRIAALLTARYWSCCWGPTWLGRGARTWGLNTGPAMGGRK